MSTNTFHTKAKGSRKLGQISRNIEKYRKRARARAGPALPTICPLHETHGSRPHAPLPTPLPFADPKRQTKPKGPTARHITAWAEGPGHHPKDAPSTLPQAGGKPQAKRQNCLPRNRPPSNPTRKAPAVRAGPPRAPSTPPPRSWVEAARPAPPTPSHPRRPRNVRTNPPTSPADPHNPKRQTNPKGPTARHITAWAEGLGNHPKDALFPSAEGRSEAAGATTKLPSPQPPTLQPHPQNPRPPRRTTAPPSTPSPSPWVEAAGSTPPPPLPLADPKPPNHPTNPSRRPLQPQTRNQTPRANGPTHHSLGRRPRSHPKDAPFHAAAGRREAAGETTKLPSPRPPQTPADPRPPKTCQAPRHPQNRQTPYNHWR